MQKFLSTRFSIVSRSKGCSAVDKASYISREQLYSEYDGKNYIPTKANEDLVHSEINLPENAPKEYSDRATLWNAVELVEKSKNAQLCRMLKASLPNDWTYEIAEEVVRKYVMDNFVSKGMCADWAIHDSVNALGQRNLHFHLLLTLRAIDENGKWMSKQKKIYILDKDGNKIRTKKGYKSKTEKTTDWDEPSNAKMWRKNLADLINETNRLLKIEETWEHKSFKELGIEEPPTIHLGSKAHALEKKGITTERGDYNRKVLEIRGLIDFIAKTSASIEAYVGDKARIIKNDVSDLISAVMKRYGRLKLPVYGGEYLRKIQNRERLQDGENMMHFAEKNKISDFDKLEEFYDTNEEQYNTLITEYNNGVDRQNILQGKINAWERYLPLLDIKKQSSALKGLAKWKYDKEHKKELEEFSHERERMRAVIPKDEKISTSKWKKEISEIENRRGDINHELKIKVCDLAYAETLKYNKDYEEAVRENEQRANKRQVKRERTHSRKHSYLDR